MVGLVAHCNLPVLCRPSVPIALGLAASKRTSTSTLIKEVEQAPNQEKHADAQPTVAVSHIQEEFTPMYTSSPSVLCNSPASPFCQPTQGVRAHLAWRIVNDGITIAKLRNEN